MARRRERTLWMLAGFGVAALVAVVVIVVLALVGGDDEPDPDQLTSTPRESTTSTTAPSTGAARPGTEDRTIQQGVFQRQYLVMAPEDTGSDAGADERLPVVVVLHGLGVDRFAMSKSDDWEGAVNDDRFIAVFPQGTLSSWNMGPCCPPASLLRSDDIGFLDQVLAEVKSRSDVDPERIFLTGFSNGGIMAYAEVCARPGVFAKVAPMAGSNLGACVPKEPIPTLHMHGDPDNVVPYDGGFVPSQLIAGADFPPVVDSVGAWAEAQGCDPEPAVESGGDIERRTWSGCDDDVPVELITYPGNGHAWPTDPLDGLDELLRFFDLR